jgi:hypothetical protein
LKSIVIPGSVTIIEGDAFSLCRNLASVSIPASVTKIGNAAFYSCESLTSVAIPETVDSIGSDAFSYCRGLTNFVFPNAVKFIGNNTLYSCLKLSTVTIGTDAKSIGSSVFGYCKALTSITCNATAMPEIDVDAFLGVDCENVTLVIPTELEDQYMSDPVWSEFLEASDGYTPNGGGYETGICSAEIDGKVVETYDLSGRKQSALQRGLNIVRMSDGTTKKVMIK